jgi:hypothetical protein
VTGVNLINLRRFVHGIILLALAFNFVLLYAGVTDLQNNSLAFAGLVSMVVTASLAILAY